MKNFIQKFSFREIVVTAVVIVCLLLFGLISLIETSIRTKLYDQQAADRWAPEGGAAQVSSFFAEGEIEDQIYFLGVRDRISKSLQEATITPEKETARLWMDAISRGGEVTISYGTKQAKVEAIGVSGDFFDFHVMEFKSGSPFSWESLHTDGIVVDEETAWQLFGSNDVEGMQVMIGQVPHFITGVIEKEAGKMAKAAGLEKPICFLSLESLTAYGTPKGGYCYEIVLPDPVKGFGISMVNKAVEAETRKVTVVENTGRYEILPLLTILQGFGTRSMSRQDIVYPYWENVARGYEDILALSLLLKLLLLIFPVAASGRVIVLLWKKKTWTAESLSRLAGDKLYDFQVKHPMPKIRIKRGYVYAFGAVLSAVGLITAVLLLTDRMEPGKQEGTKENDRLVAEAEGADVKELVFRQDEVSFETGKGYRNQFFVAGDKVYVEETVHEMPAEVITEEGAGEEAGEEVQELATDMSVEETTPETEAGAEGMEPTIYRLITAFDKEGNQISQIRIDSDPNSGSGPMTADSTGNLYAIRNEYGDYSAEVSGDKVYLEGFSPEGELLFSVYLNEKADPNTYFYVNNLYCHQDQTLVLGSEGKVLIYDTGGNFLREIPVDAQEGLRIMELKKGQLAVGKSSGEKFLLQTLDPTAGTLGEEQELPFSFYEYNIFAGKVYDIYLSNNTALYGFNLGAEEPVPLMNYLASDLSTYGMDQVVFLDENTFIGRFYSDMGDVLARFTKVDPNEVKDKQELVLGCYYLDMNVKQMVIDFSKTSQTHRIRVVEYNQYNTEEDYSQGMTRLNADIVSGNPPDIMMLQSGMPIDSYIAQGVFADYNELMEEDTTFNREDYLPNVLEALSSGDKLYQLAPSFTVTTYVGKEADVGTGSGWTIEEAEKLLASKPAGTNLFQWMTQDSFIYSMMHTASEEFVNWDTGECYFDTPDFIGLLEFGKTLPATITYPEDMTESDYQEEATQFRDGRTLILDGHLGGFRDYGNWKYAVFGEEVSMIGFPTESRNGSALMYEFNLALSNQSKNKGAAWEFVKLFLEEEYQDQLSYSFPIRISSLDKLAKRAQERPYYIDEEGKRHEYDDYYYVGDQEIKAEPLTKAESDKVLNFVKSINRIGGYDTSLVNIVSEEAALFFAGEKTAEEAAAIIQSRAKIYVNENR